MVHFIIQHVERRFNRLARVDESACANGFQARTRMVVVDPRGEELKRIGHSAVPEAERSRSRRTHPVIDHLDMVGARAVVRPARHLPGDQLP